MISTKMTAQERLDLTWGDNEDFEKVQMTMVDHKRWAVTCEYIFKQLSTGKFFSLNVNQPATEGQEMDINYDVSELVEVFPKEKTITVYVTEQ